MKDFLIVYSKFNINSYIICITYSTDIRENIKHIEKSVNTKEPRFLLRALRTLVTLRKRLNANVIRRIVNAYVQSSQKEALLKLIPEVYIITYILFSYV